MMDFTFNLGWMFGGLGIALAGGLIVMFYRPIADNLVSGVSSYGRVKLFGIIMIVVGFLIASNLMSLILTGIVSLLFGK